MPGHDYDLIVVGAGSGGCMAALHAARGGLRVLLIERRPESKIGAKVSYDSIKPEVFDQLGLPRPEGEELDAEGTDLRIFSPSKRHWADCRVPNLLVHRGLLGQRLLRLARQAGAELLAGAEVTGVIVEGVGAPGVAGVRVGVGTQGREIRARVTIDAGGFFAPVRRHLPPEVLPPYRIAREDTICGYREVRRLVPGRDADDPLIPPAGYPGYYDFLGYEGGYLWAVREADGWVNIGIGVQDRPFGPDYATTGGSKPIRGPVDLVDEFCRSSLAVTDECSARGHGGSPYIPLRRCLPRLVANGFMAVGDAAWQVCPGTGYGICSSMVAGKLAGEVAARAVARVDGAGPWIPAADLWAYDAGWRRDLGADYAFIDCIRLLLISLRESEVDWLMARGIIGSHEFSPIWVGRPFRYTAVDLLARGFRGTGRPGLMQKLVSTLRTGLALERLYRNAPETPGGAPAWERQEHALYEKLYRKLGVSLTYRELGEATVG